MRAKTHLWVKFDDPPPLFAIGFGHNDHRDHEYCNDYRRYDEKLMNFVILKLAIGKRALVTVNAKNILSRGKRTNPDHVLFWLDHRPSCGTTYGFPMRPQNEKGTPIQLIGRTIWSRIIIQNNLHPISIIKIGWLLKRHSLSFQILAEDFDNFFGRKIIAGVLK